MKSCSLLHEKLFDYVEGNLSENEKTDIEQHLIQCKNARQQLFYIKSNMQLLNNDRIRHVSNSFTERVLSKTISNQPQTINSSHILLRSLSIAAIVCGIILGVYLGNQFHAVKSNTTLSTDNQSYSLLADIEQEQLEVNWNSIQE